MNSASCDWLDDYLDGDLSAPDKICFEGHLQACSDCRQVVDEWRTTNALLKQASEQLERPSVRLQIHVAQNLISHHRFDVRSPSHRLIVMTTAGLCALAALFVCCVRMPSTPIQLAQHDAVANPSPSGNHARQDVVLSFPDDVIGVPIDIGQPDVIVVWTYPTVNSVIEQE